MVAGEDHGRTTRTSPTEAATFALERFAWEAPDRLGVSGTFSGLAATPQSPPGLVVVGHEQTHLLAAIPGSVSGPPENGAPWAAEFAWQEPPVAFEAAVLTIGDDVVVDLPEPGAKRRWARTQTLHVRRAETPAARDGRERVRLEAELLAAQEEIRELRAALERAREDVTRAQQDLQGERDRHAADAERFREGLTRVRESAAEALAVEQRAAHEADAGLRAMRAAVERRDAALRKAHGQLEAEVAARTQAETQAQEAADRLREHLAGIDSARAAADEARTELERVLSRVIAVREGLGAGR